MPSTRVLTAALLAVLLPLHVTADEPADPADLGLDDFGELGLGDLGDLDLEDELALLYAEDFVVSATRHAQRISESPSTITVITREEIVAGGYRDLADVLRTVPGGDVYRINPYTVAVGLRAGTSGTANRVLLLVDGRDMGLHTTGQPQWNALPVDLESIERIEVIRGPGSSIYGANALQGVVNVITRPSTDAPFAGEGSVSLAGPATFGADARAHGTWESLRWWIGAGYEQEAFFEDPTTRGYQSHRGRARLSWDLAGDGSATVEAGHNDASGRFSGPVGDGDGRWSSPFLLGRLRWPATEVQLDLIRGLGMVAPDVRLVAPAGALGPDPVDLGGIEPIILISYSADLTAFHALEWHPAHRLTLGANARFVHHLEGAILDCPDVGPGEFSLDDCDDAHLNEISGGLFVQDEWRVTDTLALTLGARFDVNSIHPEPGLSPRAALVWSPFSGHAFRTSVGRAYRKPSYLETHLNMRYQPTEAAPGDVASRLQQLLAVEAPNPDLVNEKVTALEAAWLGRFLRGRLTASVDLYGMWFEDPIRGDVENLELDRGIGGVPRIHPDARVSYTNYHPEWSLGGEVSVSGRPAPWLVLAGHYGYQRLLSMVEVEGETVHQTSNWTPAHRANASIRVELPAGLRLGLSAHWVSRFARFTQHPDSALYPEVVEWTGGRVLVHGVAAYVLPLEQGELEVGVTGRNLLFQDYKEFTGIPYEGGTWGGEILAPQARLFVRGRF